MQDNVWQAVLGEIELTVSRASFVTWFTNTRILKKSQDTVVIGVPNIFVKQQLERKFNSLINDVLTKNGVKCAVIEYKIHSSGIPRQTEEEVTVIAKPVESKKPAKNSLSHSYRQGLNEKYTFDKFIVGSSNELAYAAAQAIAQNPGTKYNPLFIYGGVGIGKTHLVQAIGNAVLENNPSARIVYVSTEQFVQEFLDAIRYKKNTDFAGYYRSADVLIVDDIQFIAGKEKTQEEFFHTFNALHQANKQIIISGDKPPKDIPTLEERLRSRFAWGMSIDMQTPDYETRCAILQTKAIAHGINLDPLVVDYLSNNVRTNIRELEGALNQLMAMCDMRGVDADLEIAKSVLGSTRQRPKHISAKQVIERTAKYFHISQDDIVGPKRDKDIVTPRQIAMYLLRSELHLSFPRIARELGRKDHTTAIHSIKRLKKRRV